MVVSQLRFKIVPHLIFKTVPHLRFKRIPLLKFGYSNSAYCNCTWLVVFQFGIMRVIKRIDYLDYDCKQNIENC